MIQFPVTNIEQFLEEQERAAGRKQSEQARRVSMIWLKIANDAFWQGVRAAKEQGQREGYAAPVAGAEA